ncbi:MAG: DNA-processing protein DprA [Bacteroidales bacterium]|jgi:DNA processing protein|nr:DNA-processing protein DprA [Bacteroidales bacterium]
MNENLYPLAFFFLKEAGNIFKNTVIKRVKIDKKFFTSNEDDLIDLWHLSPKAAKIFIKNRDSALNMAEKEISLIAKTQDVSVVSYYDRNYPPLLKEIPDSPVVLFVKGNRQALTENSIAVVGTRNATCYGTAQTQYIIDGLFNSKFTIVSGLAAGIDTSAHLAALKNNLKTVAVFGTGVDVVYPAENKKLAAQIIEKGGALVSEMPFNTQALPFHFPRRNRIIAGISMATVVVEASVKGGALITAHLAQSYDRIVFAVPGRNDATLSVGCNYLIKDNKAILIDSAKEILDNIKYNADCNITGMSTIQNTLRNEKHTELLQKELLILEIIEKEKPCSIDKIFDKSAMTVPEILSIITKLEIAGFIKETAGSIYETLFPKQTQQYLHGVGSGTFTDIIGNNP